MKKLLWTSAIIVYLILFLLVAFYIGVNMSLKNRLWDSDRALSECIEEELTCRQNLYLEELKPTVKPLELTEEEQQEMEEILYLPFIEELYYNPTEDIYEEPEPVCVDWIGWGENIECYKWE